VDEKEVVLNGVIVVIVLAATAETASEVIVVIDSVETAVIASEETEDEEGSRKREAPLENLHPLSEEKVVVVVVDLIAIVLVTDPVLEEEIEVETDQALVGDVEITEDPKDLPDSDGVVLVLLLVNKHPLLIFSLHFFLFIFSKILEAVQFSSLLSLRVSHSGPELCISGTNVTNEYY